MRGLAAVLLGFLLGSCGSSDGGDPQALCNEGTQIACDRVFDCAEGEQLRPVLGGTKDGCLTTLRTNCGAMPCPTGETYHADQAQTCFNALKATTCASLTNPATAVPAACTMICTGTTQ
jgi:hypothetical protein